MLKSLTLEQIDKSTNRIPFTELEIRLMMEFFTTSQKKGRDLRMGSSTIMVRSGQDVLDMAKDGILAISSEALQLDLLFAKVDAGRGLFGGQKAAYVSYVNSPGEDEWTIGTTYKSWSVAITSIGNVYRHEGHR